MIVGNGISRLLYRDEICAWQGEMWGCNWLFLEEMRPPDPTPYGKRLTRLTGHVDVMEKAAEWCEANGGTFEILAGNLGAGRRSWQRFTCPAALRKDSGTTLVAQALHEQRPEIVCVGFDLGGFDVGSPGMEKTDKTVWVWRWRTLARVYGLQAVRFIGHDHKPVILDETREPRDYARKYMNGLPHIEDADYADLHGRFRCEPTKKEEIVAAAEMVLCQRPNGTRVEYRKNVAKILASQGKLEILGEVI